MFFWRLMNLIISKEISSFFCHLLLFGLVSLFIFSASFITYLVKYLMVSRNSKIMIRFRNLMMRFLISFNLRLNFGMEIFFFGQNPKYLYILFFFIIFQLLIFFFSTTEKNIYKKNKMNFELHIFKF